MRIVHICLACFYVDGMGYQENILPKYHAKDHEVLIVTSDFAFDASGNRIKKEKKAYDNEYGIPVRVLDESRRYGPYSKYKDYDGVYDTLCDWQPDIVFCHGGQFVALKDVLTYCRKHPQVKLFIDQHGDYYNMPVDTFRRRMGQRMIYGHWMRKAVRYCERFWGVTPWRCDYLRDIYGIPEEKIGLLPMGGDDEKIPFAKREAVSREIRERHGLSPDDFVIVTGGKIDAAKRIDALMKAVRAMDGTDIKLLVFGQPNDEMREEIERLAEDERICLAGWIPSDEAYRYFLAADLAVFPGTHSVLWEQACACGVPGVFRDWEGMHHVDVGGNAVFLKDDSADGIRTVLMDLYTHRDAVSAMKAVALEKGIPTFSYRRIAARAIDEDR